jgi:hypothetical protein
MRINCGHCHGVHESVAEVKACHDGQPSAREKSAVPWRLEPGTDSQREHIEHQWEVREIPETTPLNQPLKALALTIIERLPFNKGQGHDVIEWLHSMPLKRGGSKPVLAIDYDDVPAGRFALESERDGHIVFYQVDKPGKDSRWHGSMFVKQLIGAPGDFAKQRVMGKAATDVLLRIAKDPKEAMIRFGKEVGECGACHSPLTNETSRAAGIGPVCARKRGW